MSNPTVKVGDTIQINGTDHITSEYFPTIKGSHVVVTGFSDQGSPTFEHDAKANGDYPFNRLHNYWIASNDDWQYEIVS